MRSPGSDGASTATDELDFADDVQDGGRFQLSVGVILSIIRRNIVLFAAVVVITLVIGLTATLLMTPKYTASASVQIDQRSDQILNTQDVEPAVSYQDADRYLKTQADVLRSRYLAIAVANKLKLFSPSFFHRMGTDVPGQVEGWPRQRVVQEAVLHILRDNLQVDLPIDSRIATIYFRSPDPELAATIANGFATSFISGNLQRKYDSSAYARDFLSKQLIDAKARLEQAEIQLNQYARQAGLIDTSRASAATSQGGAAGSGTSITAASLVQLNQAANDARAARLDAEARWNNAQSTPLMSLKDVSSNPAIQELQQRRAEAQANLDKELSHHKEDYPTVIQARSFLNALDEQIKSLALTIKQGIKDQFEAAAKAEDALEGDVNSLKSATLAEQDRSVRYNILAREVDTSRTLYDGLLQRYKELSATSGATTNNISLVDTAVAPMQPSSPRLFVNMALALVIGLGLGVAAVFIREQIDDVVRAPDDVERKLSIPVMGTVPLPDSGQSIEEALEQPRSPASEAYYALRTTLLHSTSSGLPHSLAVTSSQASEGKSTTSIALADDFARLGHRVLIIDTDLRRPSLHKRLGRPNETGLSSLLTGNDKNVIQPTETPNLSFLSSGPVPPDPTQLLGGAALPNLLAEMKERYDLVILDAPPVLGLADAPMIASLAEATLFVVEANRGRRGGAKAALRRLRMARANVLGAVLTKFDAAKAGLGTEYGYHYYAYGAEED